MTVYTSNRILPVRTENIPEELKVRPQWVTWNSAWESLGGGRLGREGAPGVP